MNVMLLAIALLSPAFSVNAQGLDDVAVVQAQQQHADLAMDFSSEPIFEEAELSERPTQEASQPQKIENSQLEELHNQLAQKEVAIEKLSQHLDSALKRLNSRKGIDQTPTKLSAVMAAKDSAQQRADKLETERDALKTRLGALEKEKQLLDLENRQLFHALNGVQRPGRAQSTGVYSKNSSRSSNVVSYPSY